MENAQTNNELKVSPLVFGILAILTSPIGLIFGIIGLILAKGEPRVGVISGGVICSWIGIGLSFLTIGLLTWAYSVGTLFFW